MSSKINHLKTHEDGWWLNKALNGEGQPRDLGLGLVTLPAGGARFVDAKTVARSGGAFVNALSAGLIAGPFSTQDEALSGGRKPAPPPAPKVEEAPPPPPPPPADEPVVVAVEEAPAAVAEDEVKVTVVEEPKKGRGSKR